MPEGNWRAVYFIAISVDSSERIKRIAPSSFRNNGRDPRIRSTIHWDVYLLIFYPKRDAAAG